MSTSRLSYIPPFRSLNSGRKSFQIAGSGHITIVFLANKGALEPRPTHDLHEVFPYILYLEHLEYEGRSLDTVEVKAATVFFRAIQMKESVNVGFENQVPIKYETNMYAR